jgi:two-component system phosphate regulon sensor histidine kinase PhoR
MRRLVFFKLLACFLLVIAAATLTLDLTVRRAWQKSLQAEIENSLVEKTRLFAQRVASDHALALQQLINEEAAAGNARATVIDSLGRVLAESQADPRNMENHADRPEFRAALQGRVGMDRRTSRTLGIPFLYVAVPVPGGAVRMAYPLSTLQQAERDNLRSLRVSSAIALAAALLLAAVIAHLVSRRLRRIVAFAERIATGDFSARIAETSSDEIAVVASALDRTARQLEESFAAVETSRQQLESVLNSMQEAVIAVSGDGKVLWVNGRMQRLAGGGVRVGAAVVETVRDPSFLAAVEGAISRKETCTARATALQPGKLFQVTAAPMPLYSKSKAGGVTSGAVAVLHDLTDLERVEKTRRDFIANVSHELRTPLTSVQGYTEALLDSPAAGESGTREFLEIILKNAARMSRLTEDLLVLARVESGEQRFRLQPVVPALPLQDALATFQVEAQELGMELTIESTAAEPVLADPEALHQVLANLIRNALNYAREGGKINLGARSSGGMVEFYVQDFGPGIASEHLPRLFERFYRVDKARSRESGGTGLGLAIVKHIVLAHGGQVRAASRLGHGCTFYFTIPQASAAPATDVSRIPPPASSPQYPGP